jgi:hypothetical protein
MEAIMDTENLSTTRTKIADAINSAVAMTEAETEQAVDAVLGAMIADTRPVAKPKKSLQDLIEEIQDRLGWAIGGIMTAEVDEGVGHHVAEALAGVEAHLRKAKKLAVKLDRGLPWPDKPRDLTDSHQREHEKRDLVRRLLPLSHNDFNDVMFCGMSILTAADRNEALRLLDKYPLSYVHHFLSVQKDQEKASEAAAGEGA